MCLNFRVLLVLVIYSTFSVGHPQFKFEYFQSKTNETKNVSNENWRETSDSHLSFLTENNGPLRFLNISFTSSESAIGILSKVKPMKNITTGGNNGSTTKDREETTTNIYVSREKEITEIMDLPAYYNNTSKSLEEDLHDILGSEIVKLSHDDGEEVKVGQKIEFQFSEALSETEDNSAIGKTILEQTSGTCGTFLGRRVSFAEPTTLMEYPWTALLLYNTKFRYHCGGSLITTKYVLTAAHCVAQEYFELVGVRLGEHNISTEVDCAPDVAGGKICSHTVDANVVKIIVHHDFSPLTYKNDIALLRLDGEYNERSFYPICITKPDAMFNANRATVAGWGATEKALRSTVLLQAEVPIFDISKCRNIYRYNVFNDSTEICGSGENRTNVCQGDSGGALFFYRNINGRDRYVQLGIVSLGVRKCGDNRVLPAVFTKLNGFYNWIENNLEK